MSIIKRRNNVFYRPLVDPRYAADENAQITVGDLHAVQPTLLGILYYHGFIKVSKASFDHIVAIYNKPVNELTAKDIADYDNYIDNLEINPASVNALLRLLGDEIGDRGSNDYFMLKLIEKLSKSGVNLTILLSNHGYEPIYCYETGRRFEGCYMRDQLIASSTALQYLIDQGLVKREVVDKIIEDHYIPHLTPISYSINHRNQTTVHTHAPSGPTIYNRTARDLDASDVNFISAKKEERKKGYDSIQQKFNEIAKEKRIHAYFEISNTEEDTNGPFWSGLGLLGWNRKRDPLFLRRHQDEYYQNGHDPHESDNLNNGIELDNFNGKFPLHSRYALNPRIYDVQFHVATYTHDSQRFDYAHFNAPLNAIRDKISQNLIALLPENLIKRCFDLDKIYSSFQLKMLECLFCNGQESEAIWNTIYVNGFDDTKIDTQIRLDTGILEVIYLLHSMKQSSKSNIQLMFCHSFTDEKEIKDYYNHLFLIFLILKEQDELCNEINIKRVLIQDLDFKGIYDALVEKRQAGQLTQKSLDDIFLSCDQFRLEEVISSDRMKNFLKLLDPTLDQAIIDRLTKGDIQKLDQIFLYCDRGLTRGVNENIIFLLKKNKLNEIYQMLSRVNKVDAYIAYLNHFVILEINKIRYAAILNQYPAEYNRDLTTQERIKWIASLMKQDYKTIDDMYALLYCAASSQQYIDKVVLTDIMKNPARFDLAILVWRVLNEKLDGKNISSNLLLNDFSEIFCSNKGGVIFQWLHLVNEDKKIENQPLLLGDIDAALTLASAGLLTADFMVNIENRSPAQQFQIFNLLRSLNFKNLINQKAIMLISQWDGRCNLEKIEQYLEVSWLDDDSDVNDNVSQYSQSEDYFSGDYSDTGESDDNDYSCSMAGGFNLSFFQSAATVKTVQAIATKNIEDKQIPDVGKGK